MNDNDFAQLQESIKQAGAIRRGFIKPQRVFRFDVPDIKKIRDELKVSQGEFALMIGVSVRTLQNWEQGRRSPEGPAKALLKVASHNPRAILEALHA